MVVRRRTVALSLAAALGGPLLVLAITTERAVEPTAPRPSSPERVLVDVAPPATAQGLRGTVVGPQGSLLSGARVCLLPSAGVFGDPELPAIAAVTTDRHGAFALGVATGDAEVLADLLVDSDSFATFRVARLRVFADRWLDVGTIELSAGATIEGRVVAGETGAPIEGAELQLAQWPVTLGSTSFRTVARTGADGAFAIANVRPEAGFLAAYAAGFASQLLAVEPTAGVPVEFALDPGCPVHGVVVDERGQPMAGATITTAGLSHSLLGNPRSDASGRFVVFGLGYGETTLIVQAPGYARWSEAVKAPEDALRVELQTLATMRLRVRGSDGQTLTDYRYTLRSYSKDDRLGRTDLPTLRAQPDDEGTTLVTGLDAGSYVLQIEARGHALGFSKPFEIVPGEMPPLLEVQMDAGGSIRGVVTGDDNRPLAGATVTGQLRRTSSGHLDYLEVVPDRSGEVRAVTDERGVFHLPFLSQGRYDLEIRHPGHATLWRSGLRVRSGERTYFQGAHLHTGTTVSGRVVNGGGPALVRVTVSGLAHVFGRDAADWFCAETWTDGDGRFELPYRAPPGEFEVRAERPSAAGYFSRIEDWTRSKTVLTIAPGQARAQLELEIDR